ncbi:MAG TPA: glycosyltransferase [Burkholderiaceae bacterium]|nr:glycosyltransferase [Burkholderiaceae bacterium]
MVKRVLMIAYHYPPMRGSSGIQRTLKFSQYLPEYGWQPIVLSAHPRAYVNSGDDQIGDIPNEVVVCRAWALDASRHLAIKGRYPGWLALPDRWVSWWLGAVPAGMNLIRKYRPDVIWSTYPISTAHLIALSLHRLTGIPWVADFRDPMTDVDYPPDPFTRRLYQWIEAKTVQHCTMAVCTTPGAIKTYEARFPAIPASRFSLIENGYDEENFIDAEASTSNNDNADKPFLLVHSGIIYPSERDPVPFFEALASLLQQGLISSAKFRVILRATAHDAYLDGLIKKHGIESLVSLAPHISYREALTEMLTAGGLLILQASNCNHQIPAKLYEYLRARRPILALTDPVGDTATALRNAGIDTIAPLDSKEAIMQALLRFMALVEANAAPLAPAQSIASNSRRSRTGELGNLLDKVAFGNRNTAE